MPEAPGPHTPTWRASAPWLVSAAVFLLALAVRAVYFRQVTGGEPLPLGPDGSNWLVAAGGYLAHVPDRIQANRYPLLPWLAALHARATGAGPLPLLVGASLLASAFQAALTWVLARTFLPALPALLAALLVTLTPAVVQWAIVPTAYPPFAAAFLLAACGFLAGARERWPHRWAAGLGAFAAVASMHQGALCLLALLPAAFVLGRWRTGLAALLGGAAGLLLVRLVHPEPFDPFSWVLTETWHYLSGNVPEETRADGGRPYALVWSAWSQRAFLVPGRFMAPLLALALVGQVFLSLPLRRRRARAHGVDGRRGVALALAAAPCAVLVPLLASSHHLLHLLPLLAIALVAGLIVPLPSRAQPPAFALLLAGLVAWASSSWPSAVRAQRPLVEGALREQALGRAVREVVGEPCNLLVPHPRQPVDVVWNAAWALPPGARFVRLERDPQPDLDRALREALQSPLPLGLAADEGTLPAAALAIGLHAAGPGTALEMGPPRTVVTLWRLARPAAPPAP